MRRFVVVGRVATASSGFRMDDLPGTSGRLDVLVRCVRAALLHSHGIRRDASIYLVLLGGPSAPRTVRVEGASAKFIRPDERSLATLLAKALGAHEAVAESGFVSVRPGVAVARGGLETVWNDVGASAVFVLDEGGADVREVELPRDGVFVLGDHLGFDEATRRALDARNAKRIAVGPLSLHAEDVVSIVGNELDRRA